MKHPSPHTTDSVTISWANATDAWTNGPPINLFRYRVANQFADDCADAPTGATQCGDNDPAAATVQSVCYQGGGSAECTLQDMYWALAETWDWHKH